MSVYLTKAQKGELDALVTFFGGRDHILASFKRDRVYAALRRKGMIRWEKPKRIWPHDFAEVVATARGIETAKRFRRRWMDAI